MRSPPSALLWGGAGVCVKHDDGPGVEGVLSAGRHGACLLGAALLLTGCERGPLAAAVHSLSAFFFLAGALHAAAVFLAVRPPLALGRSLALVVGAATVSAMVASLALASAAKLSPPVAVFLASALGAGAYWGLLRALLLRSLGVCSCAFVLLCAPSTATAAFVLARALAMRAPALSGLWHALPVLAWWAVFSAALLARRGAASRGGA